jgi:hypothetical protein
MVLNKFYSSNGAPYLLLQLVHSRPHAVQADTHFLGLQADGIRSFSLGLQEGDVGSPVVQELMSVRGLRITRDTSSRVASVFDQSASTT